MVVSCCVCPSGITFLELVLQCCNTFEGTALSALSLYFKALEKRGFPRFVGLCERTSGFWFCCSEVGSNCSQCYGSNWSHKPLSWKIGVLWSTQRIFRCLGFLVGPVGLPRKQQNIFAVSSRLHHVHISTSYSCIHQRIHKVLLILDGPRCEKKTFLWKWPNLRKMVANSRP